MNQHEIRFIEMQKALKKHKYKVTPQRLAILKILAYNISHPKIDEIYKILRKTFPTTSPATVYKTVAVLKELNEVLEIQYSDKGNRYDGLTPIPHPHICCTVCNKVFDIQAINFDDLINKMEKETGFEIHHVRMDVNGICQECRNDP